MDGLGLVPDLVNDELSSPAQVRDDEAMASTNSGNKGGAAALDKKGSSRMGGWLKSQAAALEANVKSQAAALEANVKSQAAVLEGTMKEFRDNTKVVVGDLADGVQNVQKEVQKALPTGPSKARKVIEERFEFTFVEKPLGFELDLRGGAVVVAMKPGGQAEKLEVQVNDRLVAVHGNELPPPDESEYFIDTVKQTLKGMGRPVVLTFVREKAGDKMSTAEMEKELLTAREMVQRYEAGWEGIREEARVAREDAVQANKDAIDAVEEAAQLRADLADLQLSKVWAADEAQRSRDEVEKVELEVRNLSVDLEKLRERCSLLGTEHAMAESAVERHADEAHESSAKAEHFEAEVQECRKGAEALRKTNDALRVEVHEATRGLKEELHEKERSLQRQGEELATSRALATEAKLLAANSRQDIEACGVAKSEAEERVSSLTQECEELQAEMERRKLAYSTSDTRINALKREVEKQRIELGRYEVLQDWVTERESLYEEVHSVRLESRRQEERVAEMTKKMRLAGIPLPEEFHDPEDLPVPATSSDAVPSRAPMREENGEADETEHKPLLASDASPKDRVAELQAQVAALLDENQKLNKQLKARPIVFQFSPDADGETPEVAAEEVEDDPMSPMTKVLTDPQSQGLGIRCVIWMVLGICISCKRKFAKEFHRLRRQPFMQIIEMQMRKFTRSLLDRPLLLWVFYGHIIALWLLELSRQAANSNRLSAAQRLEKLDFHSSELPDAAAGPESAMVPSAMQTPLQQDLSEDGNASSLADLPAQFPNLRHVNNMTTAGSVTQSLRRRRRRPGFTSSAASQEPAAAAEAAEEEEEGPAVDAEPAAAQIPVDSPAQEPPPPPPADASAASTTPLLP
mmetsp:Transcript_35588/g.83174  ORF Transcript_35588/g.83174 Transcript_35588/m.83174 type:complete len:865 (-) Transcript_35588:23-2617(-)